jgi:hypothetical protein
VGACHTPHRTNGMGCGTFAGYRLPMSKQGACQAIKASVNPMHFIPVVSTKLQDKSTRDAGVGMCIRSCKADGGPVLPASNDVT